MKEKYEKKLKELEQNIPMLAQLVAKPFEKENELAQLKQDVSKLEREISINIQANQMKQHNEVDKSTKDQKETVVTMKSLLPKKQVVEKQAKGVKI